MATIRKRNSKYQVQVRINGYISSKTFPCYELAKKWANNQEIIAFTEPEDRPRYQPANFKEILLKYWEYAQHHHKGASVEQIAETIARGIGGTSMPGYSHLTNEDRLTIARHVVFLQKQP